MEGNGKKIHKALSAPGRRGAFAKVAKMYGTSRQNVRYALKNDSNAGIIAVAAKLWSDLAEEEDEQRKITKEAIDSATRLEDGNI